MCKLLIAITCLLSAPALAAEKPPELASAIHAAAPVGQDDFHKLFFHVYDISFWSDSGGWATAPYALSITYAMDFSANELVSRTLDEMRHVSRLDDTALKSYGAQLRRIWPDIKKGDRLTALATSPSQMGFFLNGKALGNMDDPAFIPAFFGIWLSPDSSEPVLQHILTGTKE